MFADLLQRCLDAEFDEEFHSSGIFKRRKRGGKFYWYYKPPGRDAKERYVGPVTDKSITDRVERFSDIKSDYRDRQRMVRALTAAGLVPPDSLTGRLVEAMWQAGFFRLRGVLVGTVAFQAYAGLIGIDVRGRAMQTQDADFAQFWGISENIGESMPPIIEVIRSVDESFKPVTSLNDPFVSARYRNHQGYFVDTLTPNRGSDEHQSKLARMKALSNSPAQPLRHLDYCIHQTERSVLLHGGGIPVTVPRAERFAIHKVIVAVSRADQQAKAPKDLMQASILIAALAKQRPHELADAFITAWNEGPNWREKLDAGLARVEGDVFDALEGAVGRYLSSRSGKRREIAEDLPFRDMS
ncbi:MAG: hypothetical protein KKB37_01285 [Alphaproteobacteria bacterium]|nr:hypothetical protein [Alphaproteobacteria bacterium]